MLQPMMAELVRKGEALSNHALFRADEDEGLVVLASISPRDAVRQ